MQIPSRANAVPAPSAAVFRRAADSMPSGKATRSAISIARNASSRLGRRRRATSSTTGCPFRIERPRSPRRSRPIHLRYCTWIG